MDLIWEGLREAFRILGTGDRDVWEITVRSVLVSGSATGLSLVIGVGVGAIDAAAVACGRVGASVAGEHAPTRSIVARKRAAMLDDLGIPASAGARRGG